MVQLAIKLTLISTTTFTSLINSIEQTHEAFDQYAGNSI